jgi:hypothetical protein
MQWHPLFAKILRPLVQEHYDVQTGFPVGDAPRSADIVLVRRICDQLPSLPIRLRFSEMYKPVLPDLEGDGHIFGAGRQTRIQRPGRMRWRASTAARRTTE